MKVVIRGKMFLKDVGRIQHAGAADPVQNMAIFVTTIRDLHSLIPTTSLPFPFSFFSHFSSYHCRYYYGYPGLAVSLRYHCYLATILYNHVNYFATIGTKVSAPDMQPPFYLFYDYLRYDLTTTAPFLVSTILRTDFNFLILKLPVRGGLNQRCHSLKTTLT